MSLAWVVHAENGKPHVRVSFALHLKEETAAFVTDIKPQQAVSLARQLLTSASIAGYRAEGRKPSAAQRRRR